MAGVYLQADSEQADASFESEIDLVCEIVLEQLLKGPEAVTLEAYNLEQKFPTIDEFVESPLYLGKVLSKNDVPGAVVYPYWRDALRQIHPDDPTALSPREIALTGSIRRGKTWLAAISLAYDACKLMCFINPQRALGLADGTPLAIAFFNVTETLADDGIYREFNNFVLSSPWFMERCIEAGIRYKRAVFPKNIIPLIASPFKRGFGILGKAVLYGALDEISDVPGDQQVAGRIRSKAHRLYISFVNRIFTQFRDKGRVYMISSKKEESAFLESYIEDRKTSRDVAVFDGAIWDTVPPEEYSGQKFTVAVGDRQRPPEIIPDEQENAYATQGYTIIHPPIEYKQRFIDDIVDALRDIAGISISSGRASKLIHDEDKWYAALKKMDSPIKVSECVLAEQGGPELDEWFILDKFHDKDDPHWMHVDIGLSGDATGLAMARRGEGKVTIKNEIDGSQSRVIAPTAIIDFALRIKNVPGQEVSLPRLTEFIQRLFVHINIVKVTADGFQSKQLLQSIKRIGIPTELLSLDRNDEVYTTFKAAVNEFRVTVPKLYSEWLTKEMLELEHDRVRKKVDHPMDFAGSKDCADAAAGAAYHVLKVQAGKVADVHRTKELYKRLEKMGKKTGIWNDPDALLRGS